MYALRLLNDVPIPAKDLWWPHDTIYSGEAKIDGIRASARYIREGVPGSKTRLPMLLVDGLLVQLTGDSIEITMHDQNGTLRMRVPGARRGDTLVLYVRDDLQAIRVVANKFVLQP